MKKIEKIQYELLKQYNQDFNTEEIFDREPIVPFLCNEFSSIISQVEDAEKAVDTGIDDENYLSALEQAEYELSGLSHQIQELNGEVENLRAWGQSWKELAKELIETYDVKIENHSGIYFKLKEIDSE